MSCHILEVFLLGLHLCLMFSNGRMNTLCVGKLIEKLIEVKQGGIRCCKRNVGRRMNNGPAVSKKMFLHS